MEVNVITSQAKHSRYLNKEWQTMICNESKKCIFSTTASEPNLLETRFVLVLF